MLSIKYPAVLVFSVLPMHNIRKQKANFQVRSFQELSQRNMFSPPLLVWSSDLLWYKERWGLASLTSSVRGSTHDGSYPGNLAVGDAVNSLKLFKVDCESFRKGVCKPNRDGGPEHHCPAPSSVRGDVAQVWGEWRRHGQSRPQSKNHFPVVFAAFPAEKNTSMFYGMCISYSQASSYLTVQLLRSTEKHSLFKPLYFAGYYKFYCANLTQSKSPFPLQQPCLALPPVF